ncbi:MAG: helix-turn-helix domain-containing protein [Eggerthellaceae bacterium]|nr:helix-turn-helix domain-containing protein [Eggerthellaceae bacterium]
MTVFGKRPSEGYLRPRSRWLLGGAIVIGVSLFFLDYLCFMQATLAFTSHQDSLEAFQRSLIDGSVKALVLMLAFGLFALFFVLQDYQMAFATLLEKMTVARKSQETQSDAERGSLSNPSQAAHIDDLAFLESSVESMLQENVTYKNRLDRQSELMRENFVLRLLKGWTRDIDRMNETASLYGIDLYEHDMQVVVFCVDAAESVPPPSDATIAHCHLTIRDLLTQMFVNIATPLTAEIDGTLACLAVPKRPATAQDMAYETVRITKLCQQIVADKTGLAVRAAVGSSASDMRAIAQSFSEAVDLLQYARITGDRNPVSVYRTLDSEEPEDNSAYLWFSEETRFMTCIRTAEYDKARQIFDAMLASDYVLKAGSARIADFRLRDVCMLLSNALEEVRQVADAAFFNEIDVRDELASCESLKALKRISGALFDKLDILALSAQDRPTSDKMLEIVEYLSESYSDSNLSVGSIANLFGMNASYLSRTFKKRMGIGLADYITRLRVEEAKKLMRDSRISVKEAAEEVGFNNVLTMNRAFKKLEGTTAGKIRKLDTGL